MHHVTVKFQDGTAKSRTCRNALTGLFVAIGIVRKNRRIGRSMKSVTVEPQEIHSP